MAQDVVVEKKQSVIFEKAGSSAAPALAAVFVPVGDEYRQRRLVARCWIRLFSRGLQSATNRRATGIRRFAFPMSVGRR